jgi:Lauroyl/myristoyl acyltransferase
MCACLTTAIAWRFCPPMRFEPSGDAQADYQRIMQALHDVLEGYVRRYPDQWLWLHDRWKSARKRFADTL